MAFHSHSFLASSPDIPTSALRFSENTTHFHHCMPFCYFLNSKPYSSLGTRSNTISAMKPFALPHDPVLVPQYSRDHCVFVTCIHRFMSAWDGFTSILFEPSLRILQKAQKL